MEVNEALDISPPPGNLSGPKKKMNKRYSAGIICCRRGGKEMPEALLIKKRYSYAYNQFVFGGYNIASKKGRDELRELLSLTTVDEKLEILTFDFEKIWYRIWLNSPKPGCYYRIKSKFERTFLLSPGAKDILRKIISESDSIDTIWEFPKGRKDYKAESDLCCAVREFEEETNIGKQEYKIIYDMKRRGCIIDNNTQYHFIYYVAVAARLITPRIVIGDNEQTNEVADIRWMNIEQIRAVDRNGLLEALIKPVFKDIKEWV